MQRRCFLICAALCLANAFAVQESARAQYAFDILARTKTNLGDGTPLSSIFFDGGLALNNLGTAAFHGRFGPGIGTAAVMTQGGVVVQEGGLLGDNTAVGLILGDGGISLNDTGMVAFTGRIGTPAGNSSVMTQSGVLATVGGMLGNGTPLNLIFGVGTEGLNASGLAAFAGRVNGVVSTAIMTPDHVLAAAGDTLGDGSTLGGILGGHSFNDSGKVAFLGRVGTGGGPDAIMTQGGILAEVGQPLGDGRTLGIILSGASLNNNGDVEFIGRPDATNGPDSILTQHGVLVQSGQILPDGHKAFVLSLVSGTVMNDLGTAAFQGRVGSFAGPDALFTQNGLVIPVGASLGNGFTFSGFLSNEDSNKGIAINDVGQIAFLANVSDGRQGYQAVVLATPLVVPEPSGIALMSFGIIAFGAFRMRRRRTVL